MSERRNLPSASSAARYAQCPGSFLLEQQCPEPPPTPDAEFGTRVHALLAGEHVENPTDEETALADRCDTQTDSLVTTHGFNDVSTRVGPLPWIEERRIWSPYQTWSGKADLIIVDERKRRALVVDYKTGRGDVEAATGNLQLRALAVLVDYEFGPLREVVVAIVQPLAGEPSSCTYTAQDLVQATDEIEAMMLRVQQPNQPLNPSPDACKYCRAKGICPEAGKVVETLPAFAEPRNVAMSAQDLAVFLDRARIAEDVIEHVRAEAKRRLEAGETLPGWKLKPGAKKETIKDPDAVFARFCGAGGSAPQFMRAVSIAKGKLKDALKEATGLKGAALDAKLSELLDGLTETTTNAPSLVEDKR